MRSGRESLRGSGHARDRRLAAELRTAVLIRVARFRTRCAAKAVATDLAARRLALGGLRARPRAGLVRRVQAKAGGRQARFSRLDGRAANLASRRVAFGRLRARLGACARREADRLIVVGAADFTRLAVRVGTAGSNAFGGLRANLLRRCERRLCANLPNGRVALGVGRARPGAGLGRKAGLAGGAEIAAELAAAGIAIIVGRAILGARVHTIALARGRGRPSACILTRGRARRAHGGRSASIGRIGLIRRACTHAHHHGNGHPKKKRDP